MTLRRGELIAVLTLIASIVSTAWLAAHVLTDPLPPHQRQMVDLLHELGETDADLRVVVLGTSLDRNAFGNHEELSTFLSTPERRVAAVNLGVSGAGWETFAPVLDDVWAAAPDVILLQPDVFRLAVRTDDRSLRARIERWIDPPDEPPIDQARCVSQTEGRFQLQFDGNLQRHTTTTPNVDAATAVFAEAADRGIVVLFHVPPRSPRLVEALDGADVAWRAPLFAAVAAFPDVVGPEQPAGSLDLEFYCDWTHLNDDGRARVLDELRPVLFDVLDRADAG